MIDPLSTTQYRETGGWVGLEKALKLTPAQIVEEVTASGLRGRGGAGFPTGIKWKTVLNAEADQKYIVCNADEGDSGTFADRMLMEGDPFALIEGMTIAGLAVGATLGYVYIRSEYIHAFRTFSEAVAIARKEGYLGARSLARITRSISSRVSALAPMFVARKPRFSKALRASAAWCAPSRRCLR